MAFSITVQYILVAEYRRELQAENEDSMDLQSTVTMYHPYVTATSILRRTEI